jgi:hypothetical protein
MAGLSQRSFALRVGYEVTDLMNRREFLTTASAVTLCVPTFISVGVASKAQPIRATGKSVLGTSMDELVYKNFLLQGAFGANTPGYNFALYLDNNQYPVSTPPFNIDLNVTLPADVTSSTDLVISWSGRCGAQTDSNSAGLWLQSGRSTFLVGEGKSHVAFQNIGNIKIGGANGGRIVFRVSPRTSTITFSFNGSVTRGNFDGTLSNLVFCRLSDEDAVAKVMQPDDLFDDNVVNVYKSLNFSPLRPMGWTNPNEGNNVTQWKYRPNWKTSLGLGGRIWRTELQVGTLNRGTFGNYDLYTCPHPEDWSGGVEGAVIQCLMPPTANATINPTLNVGGMGAFPVLNSQATPPYSLVSGAVLIGSTASVAFNAAYLPRGTYTVTASATAASPSNLATALFNAINADAICATYGIRATSDGGGAALTYYFDTALGLIDFSASASDSIKISITRSFPIGGLRANGVATFIFDAVLKAWIYFPGGMTTYMPLECQVGFANRLDTNLWVNFPQSITDKSIGQMVAYVRDNLSPGLIAYFEYSNEIWNVGAAFPQTNWAKARGAAIGMPQFREVNSFYGLRVRQIMENVTKIWIGKRTRSELKCALMSFKNAYDSNSIGDRLNGQLLISGGVNKIFSKLVGASYNEFPNRPIDVCDSIGYAPYTAGAVIQAFGYRNPVDQVIAAADQFASGDPKQMQVALQWVDSDLRHGSQNFTTIESISDGTTFNAQNTFRSNSEIVFTTDGEGEAGFSSFTKRYFVRGPTGSSFQISGAPNGKALAGMRFGSGTLKAGVLNSETLLSFSSDFYPSWEAVAAAYDGGRPAGLSNVAVEQYEGGYQGYYPTAANCVSLGGEISANSGNLYGGPSGRIALMLYAYKNSAYFYATVRKQISDFMALPHSKTPATLLLPGFNQWSLVLNKDGDYSRPFQSFSAWANYNHGLL